ncbi:MAG TPA: mechanosensitive ion channel [Pyrinomonadaceae bacterium]|nr:mechanosensitive ion channel [Pyrinomonadaceae bacterium]
MLLVFQNAGRTETISTVATDVQSTVVQSIDSMITGVVSRLPFLLAALILVVIFWLLSKLVRRIFLAVTRKTSVDIRLRLLISRMLVAFVVGLGILSALTVVIPSFNFGNLIAGLGFSSFVIGFATKDILNNFFSGILILWQRPFQIGDYLFVGNHQGKIEHIGVRATSLRKDDGETVLIPNGDMYSSALTIRGAGSQRRMKLKVFVGYSEPAETAKAHIRNALASVKGVVASPPPQVLVSDLTVDGFNITVSFWINTNESKPMEVFDEAAIAIAETLAASGIRVFPPGSMIVQTPDEGSDEIEIKKKKSEL